MPTNIIIFIIYTDLYSVTINKKAGTTSLLTSFLPVCRFALLSMMARGGRDVRPQEANPNLTESQKQPLRHQRGCFLQLGQHLDNTSRIWLEFPLISNVSTIRKTRRAGVSEYHTLCLHQQPISYQFIHSYCQYNILFLIISIIRRLRFRRLLTRNCNWHSNTSMHRNLFAYQNRSWFIIHISNFVS